jgi:glycosyltransferase involved in cell wall biosynthesis
VHVAIVTTYPPGKGTLNEYAYHFVRALRAKEEIDCITLLVDALPADALYPTPDEEEGLASLQVVPCWQFNDSANPWRIVEAVRATKPDVVLFNIQFASFGDKKIPVTLGLTAPWLVKLAGYPSMVLLHNIMETVDLRNAGYAGSRIMEWLIRSAGTVTTRILLNANLIALTIPKYVEILRAKYRARNVLLAPHGSFEDNAPTPTFELPPGPRQLMAFGKFGTYKRIEIMVEAAEILEARGYHNLEVVIAGSDSPNAKGYLDEMRQRYAHMPNLRFTGYVAEEDVPRIFQSATVAVFPYTSTTGSSGVLHQAGSYGCAAALPHIGDFAEVITEEGYVGEFFEPDDPATLANAIAHLLDNEDLRKEMGLRNYRASCGLPIADVLDWYLLHFSAIMKQHHKRGGSAPEPAQLSAHEPTQPTSPIRGEVG